MAVSISQQKNDLKKDVDHTRRFLANSHRRRSTYELLIPNEDGNTYVDGKSCSPNNLGRISEKISKNIPYLMNRMNSGIFRISELGQGNLNLDSSVF